MIRPRILILIGSHLATAPRAQKEALALRAAGADVFVRGTWWDSARSREDMDIAQAGEFDFAPVVDLTTTRRRARTRLVHRLSRELFQTVRVVTPRAFGLGAPELLRAAKKIAADLTIVHSEAGLWVASQLIADGARVGVDFEDWFSQDLRIEDRRGRPVADLQRLERLLLRQAETCTATSHAMAESLALDADVSRVPVVIPNCFPASARRQAKNGPRDDRPPSCVSFYWVSQTIGPGRGLETLGRALVDVKGSWSVTLRGSKRGYEQWFDATFPPDVRPRVLCLSPVPNDELLARTMSHDVGLALEEPYCANKNVTASNKLFDYLRADLAVIATSTRGQAEVMSACPEAGVLVPPTDAGALARAMQSFIDHPEKLHAAKIAASRAAETVWAWERFQPVLQETVLAAIR